MRVGIQSRGNIELDLDYTRFTKYYCSPRHPCKAINNLLSTSPLSARLL